MNDLIINLLAQLGIHKGETGTYTLLILIALTLVFAAVVFFIVRWQSTLVVNLVNQHWWKQPSHGWHRVAAKAARRFSHLITAAFVLAAGKLLFSDWPNFFGVFEKFSFVYLYISSGYMVSAIINLGAIRYSRLGFARDVPIKSVTQVVKLMIFLVTSILVLSAIVDKSPTYLLSGIGALTAVLLLVFKDTILGFVASIQIAAQKMVKQGDWIEMTKFGADGEVTEINLNTVKVRNWDNTITTIPTYALSSEPFKNWRGMEQSGGRRIKRNILIDADSIRLDPNGGTNIGRYRRFAEAYLRENTNVNTQLTHMIRQLQPTAYGIPIEIYCFSKEKAWIKYEAIQAEIIEYLIAKLPDYDLRIYQRPSVYHQVGAVVEEGSQN
ncbi:mechanosensitive ion channel family protein [Algicola sagamiensis]|uniref:mechanosensitive ion channel family protein n=1 Tax=Algicola sagamiensis TaxID=163869 RepID=UPI000367EB7F|nr:mechanosensitive ion channel domain-containing protein [Algicola sagamiensis]